MDAFDDVLGAARAGAEWAWERLYTELSPRVAGYLRAHGAADPEDLVGEVFLQVVRGLDRFEGDEAALRTWVFTITHRRLVDDLRRRSRRPPGPALEDVPEPAGGDVRDEAESGLEESAVRAAIDALEGDQRTVLLLRILGDLTVEQVARALGKRAGAVKALQRRALKKIERAYPFADDER